MNDREIEKIVKCLAYNENDGWWKDGDELYLKHGKSMLEKGLTIEEVENILSDLLRGAANEFGG